MSALLFTRSRGTALEAEHHGCVAVVDQHGKDVFAAGDIGRPFYPRSAIKLIHALPFLQTGAATAYRCSSQEIALAAASHSGEEPFVEGLRAWAQRIGVLEEQLICGPDLPLNPRVADAVKRGLATSQVFHNNNAGKHLAIATTCFHQGMSIEGYEKPDHPAQLAISKTVSSLCEAECMQETIAIDNCGLPTFPISARALALGMARLGVESARDRDSAGARLIEAIRLAPEWLAGPRRLVTRIILMSGGRVIVKGGSEGVFSATIPEFGLGLCVKVNDGSAEACSAILVELLAQLGALADHQLAALRQVSNVWQKPERPERSLQLQFPAIGELRTSRLSVSAATIAVGAPVVAGETRFVDSAGREFTETPFQFGTIRHRQLSLAILSQIVDFATASIESVSNYLRIEPEPGLVIQLVGRDSRSMSYLGERRIRISQHRLPYASCLHHELTHLIAGVSALGAVFTEGLAVHVQSLFGGAEDRSFPTCGKDLDTLARQVLDRSGQDRPVKMDSNGIFNASDDLASRQADYGLCGSMVGSIIGAKGIDWFMAAYRDASFNEELLVLEKIWRQKLVQA